MSSQVSAYYSRMLTLKSIEHQIVDLVDLPTDYLALGLYETAGENKAYNELRDKTQNASKLIFVVPEYNGSFPGVLKLFLDGLAFPKGIKGKTAALVGISSGPLGTALGLSHLTDILNYLNCNVLAVKPRITSIEKTFVNNDFSNQTIKNLINDQIEQLNNA